MANSKNKKPKGQTPDDLLWEKINDTYKDKMPSDLTKDDIKDMKVEILDSMTEERIALFDNIMDSFKVLKMLLEELEKDKEIQDQIASMENMHEVLKSEALNTLYRRVADELAKRNPAIKDEAAELVAETANIIIKKSNLFKMSVDKLSNDLYTNLLPIPEELDGQSSFAYLKYEKNDSEKQITLAYNYSYNNEIFERYGLEKKFNDFDMFVMSAVDNLTANGNHIMSPTLICKELGMGDSPNPTQIKKVLNSCIKQMATIININNKEVVEAWNPNASDELLETYGEILSPLLPIVIHNKKYRINGKLADSAIVSYDISPLTKVAKITGQFTTIPKTLLVNDITKNDRYYAILHYLLQYISRYKRNSSKMHNRILYDSLFEVVGDKTARQKDSTKKTLYKILDHFKSENYISGYKEETTKTTGKLGVTFYVEPVKKISKKE